MSGKIRILALAVLRRADGRYLLEKGSDSVKGRDFYRPLGGGVEFGEYGADAVVREFREEIGKEIVVEGFLGCAENIFMWEGKPGHEVVMFYQCAFKDPQDAALAHLPRLDGNPDTVCWRSAEEIRAEGLALYPDGMARFLC